MYIVVQQHSIPYALFRTFSKVQCSNSNVVRRLRKRRHPVCYFYDCRTVVVVDVLQHTLLHCTVVVLLLLYCITWCSPTIDTAISCRVRAFVLDDQQDQTGCTSMIVE